MGVNESWYDKLPVLEGDDMEICETLLCNGVLYEITGDILQHEDDLAPKPNRE